MSRQLQTQTRGFWRGLPGGCERGLDLKGYLKRTTWEPVFPTVVPSRVTAECKFFFLDIAFKYCFDILLLVCMFEQESCQ